MTITGPASIDLVVDTSAVLAVTHDEATAERVRDALAAAEGPVVSAATVVEASIVAGVRLGHDGPDAVRALLDAADVVTIPVDDQQARLAVEAWQRFGKGHHPTSLNFGDCFSYALAAHLGIPLLCIGADFARTDLAIVDVGAPSQRKGSR